MRGIAVTNHQEVHVGQHSYKRSSEGPWLLLLLACGEHESISLLGIFLVCLLVGRCVNYVCTCVSIYLSDGGML